MGSVVTRNRGQVRSEGASLSAETKQRAADSELPRTKSHMCRVALSQVDKKIHGLICVMDICRKTRPLLVRSKSMLIMFPGMVREETISPRVYTLCNSCFA